MAATILKNPRTQDSEAIGTATTMLARGTAYGHRRVSWAAIFGGVILVVAVQLLLSILGARIGFWTVNISAGSPPDADSFGTGASIGWIVGSLIALGVGGCVAAWQAGAELRLEWIFHGLITWAIATLFTIYLLSSAIS